MQARTASQRFLVTNYDQTAFTMAGKRRDMLSQALIDFTYGNLLTGDESTEKYESETETHSELDCTLPAQTSSLTKSSDSISNDDVITADIAARRPFQGFYGFSNRSVNLLPILKGNLHNKLEKAHHEKKFTTYNHECLADNFPTYKVTENFAAATGLNCLGVSTPEDMGHALNDGYSSKIKPWEQHGMSKATFPKDALPLDVIRIKYPDHKLYRLSQIAKHAAATYPQSAITLTYVNDNMMQCNEALSAPNKAQYKWPTNVTLEVYHHHAVDDYSPLSFVGKVGKVHLLKKVTFANEPTVTAIPSTKELQTQGLFAAKRHEMMTRGRTAAPVPAKVSKLR